MRLSFLLLFVVLFLSVLLYNNSSSLLHSQQKPNNKGYSSPPYQFEDMATNSSSFSLQIISDIHIEFPRVLEVLAPEALAPRAPYLALLGDIGYPGTPKYDNLLREMAGKYQKVFVLAGNHEFYKTNYYEAKRMIKKTCDEKDNLIFMDKTSVLVDGVRILGTTLWSHIPPEHAKSIASAINDYHMIFVETEDGGKNKLTTDLSLQWHNEEVQWLKAQIEEAKNKGEKVLILTHHAPSLRGTSAPRFEGSENNGAFASDLESMMGYPVAAWCFGHTHYSSDQVINGTRVISNQVGYIMFNEESRLQPGLVLHI